MFKYLIIFIAMNIIIPCQIYSNGIREDVIEKSWEMIEYSNNFKYFNVIYNQDGEKIGLEETIEPMYGQEIVITYKVNNFSNGVRIQFLIFDYNMKNSIYKKIPIINGELRFEGQLFTNKQSMKDMMSENNIKFFCLLILPDFSIIKSELFYVNLNINLGLGINEGDFEKYNWDTIYSLESTDGEYKQGRNVQNESILSREKDGRYGRRLTYTDIMPQKTYRLIVYFTSDITSIIFEENVLDLLDYYDK